MRNQELHKVELFTHRGKRIATLYGDDESALLARAAPGRRRCIACA